MQASNKLLASNIYTYIYVYVHTLYIRNKHNK